MRPQYWERLGERQGYRWDLAGFCETITLRCTDGKLHTVPLRVAARGDAFIRQWSSADDERV